MEGHGRHRYLMVEDELQLVRQRIRPLLQLGGGELELESSVTLDYKLAIELIDLPRVIRGWWEVRVESDGESGWGRAS